jgi:preprotein translocase subunit SecD
MKIFKTIIIAFVFFGLIWVDLPENIKTKYKIPSQISFNIFGLDVKKDFTTKLGLDLKGGSSLIFEAILPRLGKCA